MLLVVLGTLAVVAGIIAVVSVVQHKRGIKFERSTKDLTYGAICLAASFALSYIKVFSLPAGGSITVASMLPILIYCYYFGFRKSLIVSTAYVMLQFIQGPYVVSPWSALFDYVFPYLAPSLVGLFKFKRENYEAMVSKGKNPFGCHAGFFIGCAVYFVARLFSHILAGVLFWSDISWMENGFLMWSGVLSGGAAWAYSTTYNIIFLAPDTAIAIVAGMFLLMSKAFNKFMANSVGKLDSSSLASSVDETLAPTVESESPDGSAATESDTLENSDTAAEND